MSSKSKKIKKPQAFVPDGLLQMRAQLSRFNRQIFYVFQQHYRMEARIEAVEEELRQEKQKNAALEQSHHRCKLKIKTLQYELLRCTLQMNCILFCNTC